MDTFATIRDTAQTLKEIVRIASAGYHDEVYLRVDGSTDTVHFITQSNARQVMSYCTFTDLQHVSGDAEAILPVGLDNDTTGYLDYLDIAEGGKTMELTLLGEEGDGDHPRLASYWQAEGALEARVRLPASRDDLEKVPWGLPERWTADESYISSAAFDSEMNLTVDDDDLGEYTPPTAITTTASTIRESVIQTADFMDSVNYYPIVVRDGDFRVDLEGNAGDDRIRGEVTAESVAGPDVSRAFDEGFAELFGELNGAVTLSTAPDSDDPDAPSPPLVVTQTERSGRVVRHVLGPFAEE